MVNCFILPLLIGNFPIEAVQSPVVKQTKVLTLMGTRFELTAVAHTKTQAWNAINAGIKEIKRLEKMISSWDSQSQTTLINSAAGLKAVQVEKELFDLIYRSKKVSNLTSGAFDITFASMDGIWKFDGEDHERPADDQVARAREKIGYKNIDLNENDLEVSLNKEGMKISFGGIGKGFAANKAKKVMEKMKGVVGGMVNAAGDLTVWGQSGGDPWKVAISDPKNRNRALGWLELNNVSIVTSGDYESFLYMDGRKYAHIVDPRTGYPVTGLQSVTIVCPDAELSDALATSVFVLGADEGMALINKLKRVEGMIVTDTGEMLNSKNLSLNYY
jgi:thiamine biosynthesis lipoprotein